MVIKIRLPRISAGAWSNIVGLAGLVAVAVAIGGLTGVWWWSLLAGGLFAVGLAYLAGLNAEETRPSQAASASALEGDASTTAGTAGGPRARLVTEAG